MNNENLFQRWRTLSFWQYLAIESGFCIIMALIIKLIFPGLIKDYFDAVANGLFYGVFFAIIDYSFRKINKRN